MSEGFFMAPVTGADRRRSMHTRVFSPPFLARPQHAFLPRRPLFSFVLAGLHLAAVASFAMTIDEGLRR